MAARGGHKGFVSGDHPIQSSRKRTRMGISVKPILLGLLAAAFSTTAFARDEPWQFRSGVDDEGFFVYETFQLDDTSTHQMTYNCEDAFGSVSFNILSSESWLSTTSYAESVVPRFVIDGNVHESVAFRLVELGGNVAIISGPHQQAQAFELLIDAVRAARGPIEVSYSAKTLRFPSRGSMNMMASVDETCAAAQK
jgi:hypothetical protein